MKMPVRGSGHSHGKAGAASSIHDTHGNADDPAVDRRGAEPEHVIEEEPILDNP
ncbi:MAG TPA: hypothetical protein VFF01_03425 [Candidatus Deferrimicrobiaceae bacterium]|nr:hypothetical protein [Candidatus Deferrimicrobiaceae bacterium]